MAAEGRQLSNAFGEVMGPINKDLVCGQVERL